VVRAVVIILTGGDRSKVQVPEIHRSRKNTALANYGIWKTKKLTYTGNRLYVENYLRASKIIQYLLYVNDFTV
jgi:hypothetical protein